MVILCAILGYGFYLPFVKLKPLPRAPCVQHSQRVRAAARCAVLLTHHERGEVFTQISTFAQERLHDVANFGYLNGCKLLDEVISGENSEVVDFVLLCDAVELQQEVEGDVGLARGLCQYLIVGARL